MIPLPPRGFSRVTLSAGPEGHWRGRGESENHLWGSGKQKTPPLGRKNGPNYSLSTGEYMSTFVGGFGLKHRIFKNLVTIPTRASDLTPSCLLPSLSETWNKKRVRKWAPLLAPLSQSSHHSGGSCGCVFPHALYPPGKNCPATFPED